jgi:hypothetical protein
LNAIGVTFDAIAGRIKTDLSPHPVYGFLTRAPNAIAKPIHPKAMTGILR